MIIDFNVPVHDEPGYGEALAQTAGNLGITRLCIGGGEPRYGLAANAEVRRLADSYPDLFVPFARLDLGKDDAGTVERFHRTGFAGLCVWAPPAAYDDESFFCVYEAAAALNMPIQFHTGLLQVTELDRALGIRCASMRPIHLDTVARCFPELKIVGVRLGNPWCEEAAELMRYHQNVFFDLSGGILHQKGTDFLNGVFRPAHAPLWDEESLSNMWAHILFGSGVRHEEIASVERDYQRFFRAMAVEEGESDAVMGGTAATLLGIHRES